jgi:aspartate/methionine/tyrosine aminotransferase
MVSVPLKERKSVLDETRWYFDPKELESRITEKSKLFSFCNPNNPTGYVYSQNDLHAIARIAIKHDLFVLCNECYERMDFRDEFEHTLVFNSLAAIPGMQERTFTLQGCTKAYETEGNMTIGWLYGPDVYVSILKNLSFATTQKWGTALGNYMGIAALTKPFRQDYARLRLKDYRWGRDLLWETLKKFPWIECGKAKGGPFMFPDVTGSGMSDTEFSKFLNQQGVGAGSGTAWAEDPTYGEGHIRFSYCSPMSLQEEMIKQLEEALKYYEIVNKDQITT